LKSEDHCNCGYEKDPGYLASLKAKWAIPAENVPRERRRMEIRKQLQFKEGIAGGGISVCLLFSAIIMRDLVGATTFASFFGLAVVTVTIMMFCWWGVDKVFRKIEKRRLESEFPSAKPAL
jgi:hypothetical protein